MKTTETKKVDTFYKYLIVALLALICYANTLFGTFVFDDTEAVVKNKDILPSTPILNVFKNDFWGTDISLNISHKSYRPLTILTYRLNVLLSNSELNEFQFHITNVFLYMILCISTLPVYQLLLKSKYSDGDSFMCSLIFTVHPIHAEVIASIVGRADILAALLYLFSFLLYNKVIKQGSHKYFILVVIFIVAATLCKETAITALSVCCIQDFLCSKFWRNGTSWCAIKKAPFIYRTLGLIASGIFIMYFRLKIMNFEGPNFTVADNPAAFSNSSITKILTYNYIYFLNFLLLLWPEWLCFDWSMGCIPLIEDFCDVRVVSVLFFWSFIICSIYKILRRILKSSNGSRDLHSIIMAWSFIVCPFLPASNLFLKVGFVVAERILLLPSLGFILLSVIGFRKLSRCFKKYKNELDILFYSCCVMFVLRTIQRNVDWLSEENLFNSALKVCPLNAKVHYNVAKVAADNNKKVLAIDEYSKAIELNPLYEQAMNNLANLLREEKQFEKAEILLRKALKIRPNFAAAWMNLGIVLTNLNQSEEAEGCYLTAISFRKKYPDCYYNLGNLYLDLKRNEEALKAWEKAVSFRPTHTAAWSNMLVLLDSLKQFDEVLDLGNTALMHNPMSAALHFSIANTLGKVQQFEKAEKHFLEALNLNPNNALYYSNLGVLYHRWRKSQKAIEMYKKALQIDPNMKTAESNLRKLINIQ